MEAIPRLRAQRLGIDLALPQDLESLALSVVIDATQADQMSIAERRRWDDFFDEVLARAYPDNLVFLRGFGDLDREWVASAASRIADEPARARFPGITCSTL